MARVLGWERTGDCRERPVLGGRVYIFSFRTTTSLLSRRRCSLPWSPPMFIRLSSTVPFHLSTPNSILFSLLASVFLLAVIRAALLFLRSRSSLSQEKRKLVGIQTENAEQEESQSSPSSPTSRGWACFKWDNLPTLPVSLKLNENDMKGQGVGFVAQQRSAAQPWRRAGPAFESPRMLCGYSVCFFFTNQGYPTSTRNVSNRCPCVNGEDDHVKTCV